MGQEGKMQLVWADDCVSGEGERSVCPEPCMEYERNQGEGSIFILGGEVDVIMFVC